MTQEPVPTAADLVAMGREYAIASGYTGRGTRKDPHKPTGIRILEKGHVLLGEIMRRNGQAAREAGVGDWYPDAPHSRPRT